MAFRQGCASCVNVKECIDRFSVDVGKQITGIRTCARILELERVKLQASIQATKPT